MCSIFGLSIHSNSRKFNHEVFLSSNLLLSHRGPDHSAFYTNHKNIYFSHNRLSIIGLNESSNQPMQGCNGTVIVFNGEIYNYKDLKKTELSNYSFQSNSDTEVILALYEKYGIDCVHHLRGMFAFAIWDEQNKRLFCARDRFGVKPFYFTNKDEQFVFASEMKALLPFLDTIETNYEALSEYLTFQYTLDKETLFKRIHQLMPGHLAV